MGNSESVKLGYMYIKTNKQVYVAGDEVRCILYLNVIQEGIPARGIDIYITGTEETGLGKSGSVIFGYQILTLKECIYQFQPDNIVKTGQFEFPFVFQLPPQTPGSYQTQIEKQLKASIKYEIMAEISSLDKTGRIQAKQEIQVREPLKEGQREIQMEQIYHPIQFFCIQKGVSALVFRLTKNVFILNETVQIWIDIDNRMSELDLERIRVSLLNKIIISNPKNQTVRWDIEQEVNQVEISGLGATLVAVGKNRMLAQLILTDRHSGALKPTVEGMSIHNKYELKIEVFFEGFKFGGYREIYIPIILLMPIPLQNDVPAQPPQDWNPEIIQEHELSQLNIDEKLGNHNDQYGLIPIK